MSSLPDVRALVLAAGEGRRLQPLTAELPKPLLPVLGRSILEHSLDRLIAAGVGAIAINLHHLGEAIQDHLGGQYRGVPLRYSPEPVLLGTGGALGPLRDWFGGAGTVLIVNGDSLCRWPVRRLLRRHRRRGADATLLVAAGVAPGRYGGGIGLDRGGGVVALPGAAATGEIHRRCVFLGLHALRPELLEDLPPGPSDSVRDLYALRMEAGRRLTTLVTRRRWHDLGTPERYWLGVLDSAARHGLARGSLRGNWVAPTAELGRRVRLRQAVIESGVEVGRGTRLRRTVVLPGARIGAGVRVRDSIVGPGVELPAGASITRQLVTRWREDRVPGNGSRMGALWFTPMGNG